MRTSQILITALLFSAALLLGGHVVYAESCHNDGDCSSPPYQCDIPKSVCFTQDTVAPAGTAAGTANGGTAAGAPAATESGGGLQNPLKNITDLPSFLQVILKAVTTLGTMLLTLMLIFVGFKFVAAQGNAEELKSARAMLMWTVIGGLVLLGASAIGAVIQSTVNGL